MCVYYIVIFMISPAFSHFVSNWQVQPRNGCGAGCSGDWYQHILCRSGGTAKLLTPVVCSACNMHLWHLLCTILSLSGAAHGTIHGQQNTGYKPGKSTSYFKICLIVYFSV
jgi:hypothetical protein